MGWSGVMGRGPSDSRCGGGGGWPGCRGAVLRARCESAVADEAKFDLFAPNTNNDDLYRPLGALLFAGIQDLKFDRLIRLSVYVELKLILARGITCIESEARRA